MLLSVLQSLVVPMLLGVEQYGYWQLFMFYTGYVGIFHLGLNDGVYLIDGGQTRDEIDKRSVNSQFIVGLCFQSALAAIIVFVALQGGFGSDRDFVIVCTGIQMVLQNASAYISVVLQAMNETKKSSFVVIASKVAYIIPLICFLLLRIVSFRPYVVAFVVSTLIGFLLGVWYVLDFVRAGLMAPREAVQQSIASVRVGIKLMISNTAGGLILGVARFLIDAEWGISTFGKLSLSLSMVTFFFAFVNQASLVLFPALRQSDEQEVKSFFYGIRDAMGLLMPIVYLLYYPLVWFLSWLLPAYASSMVYFAMLLPLCVFDGKMDIYCTTFFKVTRREGLLLKINIISMAISFVGALVGTYVVKSVEVVLLWVVVVIIGRSYYSDSVVSGTLELPKNGVAIGELAITVAFVALAYYTPVYVSLPIYAMVYAVFLFVNRGRLSEVLGSMRKAVR